MSVVVVGAGPVGLALACQLKVKGVEVRILDKLEAPIIRTKAAGIWSRTSEMLEAMGLAERFVDAGFKSYGASIYVGGQRVTHLSLEQLESYYNYILMLPQNETERLLTEHLSELGVSIERNMEVESFREDADGVVLSLVGGEEIQASYVVGCDGAHSAIRHQLGDPFEGTKEAHQWVVGDMIIKGLSITDEVLVYLHEDGPLALFPLGHGLYRTVAEVPESEDKATASAESAAREAIIHRLPDTVEISEMNNTGYFAIHERQVKQYRRGRVFLAGDAAHVHSPLGGQGMNTGLQDTFNLAWKLSMVIQGELNEKVLESYHDERYPIAHSVLQKTGLGTHMITLRAPIARAIRDKLVTVISNLPPIQKKARTAMSELDIHYHKSFLSREPVHTPQCWLFGKGISAGGRAEDGLVTTAEDKASRLHLELRSPKFQLLLFLNDRDRWDVFETLVEQTRTRFQDLVRIVWIGFQSTTVPPTSVAEIFLHDHHGELHHSYGATESVFYLVRPDGYIATRDVAEHSSTLFEYLEALKSS